MALSSDVHNARRDAVERAARAKKGDTVGPAPADQHKPTHGGYPSTDKPKQRTSTGDQPHEWSWHTPR